MYRNSVTSDNTPDSHKAVITGQVPQQLADMNDDKVEDAQKERIKTHFKWLLSNDFYKDACTTEQVTNMESHLPANYADDYVDLPS